MYLSIVFEVVQTVNTTVGIHTVGIKWSEEAMKIEDVDTFIFNRFFDVCFE